MSRIYMRVNVSNDSKATLRLKRHWTSNDWTPGGWHPEHASQAAPGKTLSWQAEGDNFGPEPIKGVEARTWYDVLLGDQVVGELYIFANSPWKESQYGNTFHVHAPPGFYAAYVDAEGQKDGDNRAILNISFRSTRKVAVPNFIPSHNGFLFSNNDWSDQLPVMTVGQLWNRLRGRLTGGAADALGIGSLPDDWMPITHADAGMCGGMVYAVMDYFHNGQLPPPPGRRGFSEVIPNQDGSRGGEGHLPPDGADDPLFQHVKERLLDSFDFDGRGERWLSYSSALYPDDDEGAAQAIGLWKGKSWVTYREEWPRIRQLLDDGKPVCIGLVQSAEFRIDHGHQVLAYAYEQSGQQVKLWIYDPIWPPQSDLPIDDLQLRFDTTDTSHVIAVNRHSYTGRRIYAILHMDNYRPRQAPLGRPYVPPPGVHRPRAAEIEATQIRLTTIGGVAREERQGHCGNLIRIGRWTLNTEVTFALRISNVAQPVVSWSLNGVAVEPGAATVTFRGDGARHTVQCRLHPGGRSLGIETGGDTMTLRVNARVVEAAAGVDFMHPNCSSASAPNSTGSGPKTCGTRRGAWAARFRFGST